MAHIPEVELTARQGSGDDHRLELGAKPALIVVDVTLGFTGSEGVGLEAAITEYPNACGPAAWEAMPAMAALIELFRGKGMPIVYTRADTDGQDYTGRASMRMGRRPGGVPPGFGDFPSAIAPRSGEWVLAKTRASAFFGTPLSVYLTRERVDSIVICGGLTSACVRATAVDACSNGYDTFVIDDACFDRSPFAHGSNLFDLGAKYAEVLSLDELAEKWRHA
jgi:maleamate amidohydrolase